MGKSVRPHLRCFGAPWRTDDTCRTGRHVKRHFVVRRGLFRHLHLDQHAVVIVEPDAVGLNPARRIKQADALRFDPPFDRFEILLENTEGEEVELLALSFADAGPTMGTAKGIKPKAVPLFPHIKAEGLVELFGHLEVGYDHIEGIHRMNTQLSRSLDDLDLAGDGCHAWVLLTPFKTGPTFQPGHWSGAVAHRIRQQADTVDLHFDGIPLFHPQWRLARQSHTRGRSGYDHIAGLQRHELRQDRDQPRHRKYHVGNRSILHHLTIQPRLKAQPFTTG